MSLPINATPTYNLILPSTGEEIMFRPFLVKDEKALLIAQQSEDAKVMIETLKEVIKSCVKTKIDVEKLASFDIEYLFTQIRAKSVGEIVELIFPCQHCDDEKAKVKVSIDITNIKVQKPEDHDNNIQLFGEVGVVMRYPGFDLIQKLEKMDTDNLDAVFSTIAECIDYVYSGEELYYASETSKKDMEEFLNNLTSEQFAKIQKFFLTMPKIKQEVEYTCPVCNAQNHTVLEGLTAFF